MSRAMHKHRVEKHKQESYRKIIIIYLQIVKNIVLLKNVVGCLLYTSDAADERSSVDLGGRRIIKKKK